MQSRSMRTSQKHPFSCSFSIVAGILLLTAFVSAVNAAEIAKEVVAKEKYTADQFFVSKSKCKPLAAGAFLAPKVQLLTATTAVLDQFLKDRGVEREVAQVEVRTTDGYRYFIVREGDSSSYSCNLGTPLGGPLVSVEPQAATVFNLGPCCTSTTGGDAQAQWFNLTNCPLYKPRLVADWICGH